MIGSASRLSTAKKTKKKHQPLLLQSHNKEDVNTSTTLPQQHDIPFSELKKGKSLTLVS